MGCGASAPRPLTTVLKEAIAVAEIPAQQSEANRVHVAKLLAKVEAAQAPAVINLRDVWNRATSQLASSEVGRAIVEDLVRCQPTAAVYFAGVSLEKQGKSIARMIEYVCAVEAESSTIVSVLLSLGARHSGYGVPMEFLGDMRDAATNVLENLTELSHDELDEWNRIWATVIDLMTHGMTSPEGQANKRRYEANVNLTLQQTWQKIRLLQADAEGDMQLFSKVMYKNVLQARPDFARFSNLTDFRTAERVMIMLTTLLDSLVEGKDCSAMLRESGARHLAYDVSVDDMMAFEEPFLKTCEAYLGSAWNVVLRHHLSSFWRFIVNGMSLGMNDAIDKEALLAPRGDRVAICFTDIEKSTRLWEANPGAMGRALEKHNRIIRQLIQEYRGYEIKTIGDSFMVAFHTMTDAVLFSCCIQTELLLQTPSAPGFVMVKPTQGDGSGDVWDEKTLRVRVGIEWCDDFAPQFDAVHRRFDYFGPSINLAARIQESAAGGQILVKSQSIDQLRNELEDAAVIAPPEFTRLTGGTPQPLLAALDISLTVAGAELKGVSTPVDLVSILPVSLAKRRFDTSKRVLRAKALSPATVGRTSVAPLSPIQSYRSDPASSQ